MPSKPRKKKNEPEVLHIEGELTISRATELMPQILSSPPPAAIDLSGVTEFDTAGLQLLLLARKTALAEQRVLRLVAPSAAVCEVLELLNAGNLFDLTPASMPAGA